MINGKQESEAKRQRGKEAKNRRILPHYASMRLCVYASLLFTIYNFLFASPCFAVPWNNKPLPRINTKSKIDYVNINWWDNFSDPYLKCYIIQAIEKAGCIAEFLPCLFA